MPKRRKQKRRLSRAAIADFRFKRIRRIIDYALDSGIVDRNLVAEREAYVLFMTKLLYEMIPTIRGFKHFPRHANKQTIANYLNSLTPEKAEVLARVCHLTRHYIKMKLRQREIAFDRPVSSANAVFVLQARDYMVYKNCTGPSFEFLVAKYAKKAEIKDVSLDGKKPLDKRISSAIILSAGSPNDAVTDAVNFFLSGFLQHLTKKNVRKIRAYAARPLKPKAQPKATPMPTPMPINSSHEPRAAPVEQARFCLARYYSKLKLQLRLQLRVLSSVFKYGGG